MPVVTANQMPSFGSKGSMKAQAAEGDNAIELVNEVSLPALGHIDREMTTGGSFVVSDLSANVHASADAGGSKWQVQAADSQEAHAGASTKKQADAEARVDAAIGEEIHAQAELKEWQRRERAVRGELEMAAQQAYAIGHDAENAAKHAFLMSGGKDTGEWRQSERTEHPKNESFAVGMHADEELKTRRPPIMRRAQASLDTEMDDFVQDQWSGHHPESQTPRVAQEDIEKESSTLTVPPSSTMKQVEITPQASIEQVERRGSKKATVASKRHQDPQQAARDRAVARAKTIVAAKSKAKHFAKAQAKSQMLAKAGKKLREVTAAKKQVKKGAKKSPKKSVKKHFAKTQAKRRSPRR